MVEKILLDLRMGKKCRRYVKQLICYHDYPYYLFQKKKLQPLDKTRFWLELSGDGFDVCLLSLASFTGSNSEPVRIKAYREFINGLLLYGDRVKKLTTTPLLNGEEIRSCFNLEEGPVIGYLLKKLKEAQANGKVMTRKEAINYLEKYIKEEL